MSFARTRGEDAPHRPAAVDPAQLMSLAPLELRVRRLMEGLRQGQHRSPRRGFSAEFHEHRAYVPGDDPRFIDWRLTARRERPYVKQFEEETSLRCHLLLDGSASMSFGSLAWRKCDYAATVAATLACLLAGQGDAVGVITFSHRLHELLPPRYRPGQLARVMEVLTRAPSGARTDLDAALAAIADRVPRRSLLVLLSDLLAPVEGLARRLSALSALGHEVAVLEVLDPAELDLSLPGTTVVRDLESGQRLAVDPAQARPHYRAARAAHQAILREACLAAGVDHQLLVTDQPLAGALLGFLDARERRRLRR